MQNFCSGYLKAYWNVNNWKFLFIVQANSEES